MTHLDLFSGIGGFALAAKWAGIETIQFCEIDPFCHKVLNKNFPGIPIHDDIRTLSGESFRGVGIVTGGFPCQDISAAGKGVGIEGARSGLYFEMLRIVRESEPLFVLAENSPALRTRGADRVLDGLESLGYTCGAFVVGGGVAGSPDIRERVWLVAHSDRVRELQPGWSITDERGRIDNGAPDWLDSHRNGWTRCSESTSRESIRDKRPARSVPCDLAPWRVHQPPIPGVDARLSRGLDPYRTKRIKALGNAVKPQIPYLMMKIIKEWHEEQLKLAA